MKLNISKVQFSKNDIRRKIKIPSIFTEQLAEDIGHHIGDGYMKERDGKGFHKYELLYFMHSIDDKHYFRNVFLPRKQRLFNFRPNSTYKYSTENSIYLRIQSKAILTFYRDVIGVQESPKINMKIPKIIFSKKEFMAGFLRGYIDSDGCLYFMRKKKLNDYSMVRFDLSDNILFKDLKKVLKIFGFTFCDYIYRKLDRRTDRTSIAYKIDVCGNFNLKKWIDLIGFNNQKHIVKYSLWKKVGHCPPNISLNDRIHLLRDGPEEI